MKIIISSKSCDLIKRGSRAIPVEQYRTFVERKMKDAKKYRRWLMVPSGVAARRAEFHELQKTRELIRCNRNFVKSKYEEGSLNFISQRLRATRSPSEWGWKTNVCL